MKHLSVHQWLRSAIPDSQQPTSPIGFLFLKLPPPPCAVLLVSICPLHTSTLYTQMYLSLYIYIHMLIRTEILFRLILYPVIRWTCMPAWMRQIRLHSQPFYLCEWRPRWISFLWVLYGFVWRYIPVAIYGEIRWGKWWLALISHCIWKYPNFDACTLPTTSSRSMIQLQNLRQLDFLDYIDWLGNHCAKLDLTLDQWMPADFLEVLSGLLLA